VGKDAVSEEIGGKEQLKTEQKAIAEPKQKEVPEEVVERKEVASAENKLDEPSKPLKKHISEPVNGPPGTSNHQQVSTDSNIPLELRDVLLLEGVPSTWLKCSHVVRGQICSWLMCNVSSSSATRFRNFRFVDISVFILCMTLLTELYSSIPNSLPISSSRSPLNRLNK